MVQLSHLDTTTGKTIVLNRKVFRQRMSSKCVTPTYAGGAKTPWAGGLPFKGPSGVGGPTGRGVCHHVSAQTQQSGKSWLQASEIVRGDVYRELADSSKLDTCLLNKKNEALCSLRWQPKGHRSFN